MLLSERQTSNSGTAHSLFNLFPDHSFLNFDLTDLLVSSLPLLFMVLQVITYTGPKLRGCLQENFFLYNTCPMIITGPKDHLKVYLIIEHRIWILVNLWGFLSKMTLQNMTGSSVFLMSLLFFSPTRL